MSFIVVDFLIDYRIFGQYFSHQTKPTPKKLFFTVSLLKKIIEFDL
jgi:hypothetical protein